MKRVIFWDTMLFIHLLDSESALKRKVRKVFQESVERKDKLVTSCLVVGEVVAGSKSADKREILRTAVESLGFELLSFNDDCIPTFGRLRSQSFAVADSIHLACAAANGVDLFLTQDKKLHRAHVPGIKFIAGMESAFPE